MPAKARASLQHRLTRRPTRRKTFFRGLASPPKATSSLGSQLAPIAPPSTSPTSPASRRLRAVRAGDLVGLALASRVKSRRVSAGSPSASLLARCPVSEAVRLLRMTLTTVTQNTRVARRTSSHNRTIARKRETDDILYKKIKLDQKVKSQTCKAVEGSPVTAPIASPPASTSSPCGRRRREPSRRSYAPGRIQPSPCGWCPNRCARGTRGSECPRERSCPDRRWAGR